MRFSSYLKFAASLMLLCVVAGCPGKARVQSANNAPGSKGDNTTEEILTSAVSQLTPANYTIFDSADKQISLLNSWHSLVPESTIPAVTNVPAGWLNEAQAARVKSDNYDLEDAVHIRDAILCHSIVGYLSSRAPDEVGQARAVFDFVVRNVNLRGDDDPEIPLGVYELLLLGQGSPEDRAWVTASLLRQLRIDSVIVRPTGQTGANQWLLGVLLDGKVYLFDARLGLAVPSSDKLSVSNPPATLAEIPSHPEWLQKFDVKNDEYPIKAESLKQVDIQPIVQVSAWTRRIQQLESVLPAEVLCVLSDPLSDEAGRNGLLSRLKAASWNPEVLKPWPYPQQQREAIKSATPAMQMAFEVGRKILSVPIPYKVSEANELSFGHPERKLLRIRTDQLQGKFEDATQRYLSIRHMEIESAPVQELAVLNRLAAENAIYWTAVSKFEFKEYEAAIEQLNAYLKRYDRSGRWRFAARALMADCHAEVGHFKEAADALERSRSDDPYRVGNAVRVKMWKAKAE